MSGNVVDLGPQAFARISRRTGREWLEIAFPEDWAGSQYVGIIGGEENIAALRDFLNAQVVDEEQVPQNTPPASAFVVTRGEFRLTGDELDAALRRAAAWDRAEEIAKKYPPGSFCAAPELQEMIAQLREGRP